MSVDTIVGIDLGTTNSEVCCLVDGKPHIIDAGGNRGIVPSCVGLDARGEILVGTPALNQLAAAPERTVRSVKRLLGTEHTVMLGDQSYTPAEIAAFILKELKQQAERYLDQTVDRAVITVPAYATDAQRQATRAAGSIAGLEVVRIINEPTAAALAYGARRQTERSHLLVYDLGGGTFDVSVVAVEGGIVEVLASTGDNRLGGDDFDQRIVDRLNRHITEELGIVAPEKDVVLQMRLAVAAEQAKRSLSSAPFVTVNEDHVGMVDGHPCHLSCELSRLDFDQDIAELLERTMTLLTAALKDAGIQPRQLDRVLLVGGSTRIPLVGDLLREHIGNEPHGEVDPDLCVALGAGVQAGMEMGLDVDAVLVDVTPYTFGTRTVGEYNGELTKDLFVPLIHRNSRLPARQTNLFTTLFEDQEMVEVEVFQGDHRDVRNNVRIGTFLFEGLNSSPEAFRQGILLTYDLDLDGILHVHAVERATGRQIEGVVDNAIKPPDANMLKTARDRIESAWQGQAVDADDASSEAVDPDATDARAPQPHTDEDAVAAESGGAAAAGGAAGSGSAAADPEPGDSGQVPEAVAHVLDSATRALDKASEEDQEEMIDLMEDLREAARTGSQRLMERTRTQLEDILFYLE